MFAVVLFRRRVPPILGGPARQRAALPRARLRAGQVRLPAQDARRAAHAAARDAPRRPRAGGPERARRADEAHVDRSEASANEALMAPDDVRHRHRRRHDRHPQPGRVRRRSPAVSSYREFTQHFPQPGWVEHDADEIWAAVRATLNDVVEQVGATTWRRSASPTSARPSWRGTARRASPYGAGDRVAGPPHGGPLRRARRRRRPRPRAPAHRARARPVLQRHQVRVAADPGRRAGRRRPGPRHDRHVADLEPHRRRASTSPTPPTPAARCCSTSAGSSGTTSCASCCTSPIARCPRSCRRAGRSA